jgi:hypothetical protein
VLSNNKDFTLGEQVKSLVDICSSRKFPYIDLEADPAMTEIIIQAWMLDKIWIGTSDSFIPMYLIYSTDQTSPINMNRPKKTCIEKTALLEISIEC